MRTVCHITTVHGPFDDRIYFKQCRSLAQAGYTTVLVAPVDKEQEEGGVRFKPVKVPANRLLRATVGGWRAYRIARSVRADLYQIHDPELLWVAWLLKKRTNRVVYDMHESMRGHILSKTWLGPTWFRRVASRLYAWMEDTVVRRIDAVIVVVERMREELAEAMPDQAGKVLVVRNLPVVALIDHVVNAKARPREFTLIYVGGLSRVRGLHEVIQALEQLPDVRLKLLGPWSDASFRAECAALPGWGQVQDLGQVRMDEVYDHIRAAHVGVCILYPLHNYQLSLPIKAFEYMACGLPMLMSDFPFWQRTFGPYARFTAPQDVNAMAQAIRALQETPGERERMGVDARKEVLAHYSWESEQRVLVDLYRRLLP
jgi:glycosyltransferase involved in cell wall biosynthesis